MQRLKLAIALVPALGLFATTAPAADLGPFGYAPAPESIAEPIVEIGTGWYIRGDGGAGKFTQAQITADAPAVKDKNGWDADVGIGYKFNDYFRTDVTFGLNQNQKSSFAGTTAVICPYTLHGLTSQGADPVELGYLFSPQSGTCTAKGNATLKSDDLLFNAYFDLGTWYGLTPYIGAGVGVSQLRTTGMVNYYKTSDGSVYNTDLTPTGTYPLIFTDVFGNALNPQPTLPTNPTVPVSFGPQNWSTVIHKTKYNLAWALMGGVAYNITDHLAVDVGYRYLNRGTYKSLGGQTNPSGVDKTLSSQEIRVGLRYLID